MKTPVFASGGSNNDASGHYSSISGGADNTAVTDYASVSGGSGHRALFSHDWAAGSLSEDY